MTSQTNTQNTSGRADLLSQISTALAETIAGASPAVVQVQARRWRPASGTIYAANLVVTADHVLEQDEGVLVRMGDGRAIEAEIIGRDPATDLALLRAEGVAAHALPAVDDVKVGHLVVALARSWSNRVAAAAGIVGVVGGPVRAGHGRTLDEVIRLDVAPHPAFSGGPVVDAGGRLVGIGTAGLIRDAAAAVPARIAWRVAAALAEHGHIRRGYLGINTQPVRIPDTQRSGLPGDRGLLVAGLADGSPAAAAGFLVGDILVGFGGAAVAQPDDLLSLLTADRIGQTVQVKIVRGADQRSIDVTVGDRHSARG